MKITLMKEIMLSQDKVTIVDDEDSVSHVLRIGGFLVTMQFFNKREDFLRYNLVHRLRFGIFKLAPPQPLLIGWENR